MVTYAFPYFLNYHFFLDHVKLKFNCLSLITVYVYLVSDPRDIRCNKKILKIGRGAFKLHILETGFLIICQPTARF